jgi:hypothetical protein
LRRAEWVATRCCPGLGGGRSLVDYKGAAVTNVQTHATHGGYMACQGCDRLEAMGNTDVARLGGPGPRWMTHDRRASADVGYRVWNPFEAELRSDAGGRYEELAKGFARVIDVFDR